MNLHTAGASPRVAAALADRFRLEGELGSGAMAVVYRAHDLRHDRPVALKVLRGDMGGIAGASRFLREIRLAARLAHPHILPLFDSGEANGALWYAMPVVEGGSLRALLDREHRLAVDEAVQIAVGVAAALAYAHAQGVVHRDIKPENILLHDGHALVADLGIGKAASDAELGATLTQHGMTLGTPAYMSPEQAAGEEIDGRSDVYSLGCVLYEMLAGEPPFTGPNAQAVLAKRFVQLPADVGALREGIPGALAAAVRQALQRNAVDRPPAAEWASALKAALSDTAPRQHERAAPAHSIAVLPFTSLSDDRENEYFGDGIAEEVIDALARIPGLFVAARVSSAAYKGRHASLATIGRELNVATVLQGSVRRSGSRVRITAQLVAVGDGYQLWSERYDRDLTDVFAVQDEIAGAIARRLELQFAPAPAAGGATTALVEARELVVRGRLLTQQRGRALLEAVACLERALEIVVDDVDALTALGNAQRVMGQHLLVPAAEASALARETLERALELQPDHAEAMGHLGTVLMNASGSFARAMELWERALVLDPRLTEIRALRALWGLALAGGGARDGEAEREIRRALADDPLNPIVSTIGSLGLSLLGKAREAPAIVRRVLDVTPEAFAPTYALCWTLNWAGHAEEALAATETGMERFGRHPWLLHNLVGIYMRLEDRRRAEAVHTELAARAVTARVPHFSMAYALMYLGRLEEALVEVRRSIERGDSMGPRMWERWGDLAPLKSHPGYAELSGGGMADAGGS